MDLDRGRPSIVHLSRYACFEETVQLASLGGFQGIDVDIVEIKELLKPRSIDVIKDLLKENDLRLGGWGLPVDIYSDEGMYQKSLKALPECVEIAELIDCRRVFTWLHPFSDTLSFDKNWAFHVSRLRPVADILQDHGCQLGLEFAGTKALRTFHKHEFIHTIESAIDLCKDIGTGNLGLLLDSWNWHINRGTLNQLRRLRAEQIIYVQVNDAPRGVPIDQQNHFVRCLPGETGVIDLIGFLKTLKEIGYDGPVAPEPFSSPIQFSLMSMLSQLFKEDSSVNRKIQRLLFERLREIQRPMLRWVSPQLMVLFRNLARRVNSRTRIHLLHREIVRLAGDSLNRVWEDLHLN